MAKRRKQPEPNFRKRQLLALLAVFVFVGTATALFQSLTEDQPKSVAVEAEPKPSFSPIQSPSPSPDEIESSVAPDPEFTYADKFIPPVVIPGLQTCANKESGLIRQIKESNVECSEDEFDLGNDSIDPGDERPGELNSGLMQRFMAVKVAAKISADLDLEITSGWRSLEYQEELFENSIKKNGSREEAMKWVALPEVSMHPWGLAIDINYVPDGREEANWVERHGYLFGLCRAYENEWWHFEPLAAPGEKCPKMRKDANVGYAGVTAEPTP
jgi:LAS superfamily LD-carboxypeptidase LdcB